MNYVLEWRAPRGAAGPVHAVVSYVRVFHSAAALKAFVRSHRFKAAASGELRLSIRGQPSAGPIFTTAGAILAWDPLRPGCPTPLLASRWADDLAVVGLAASVRAAVARHLDRARRAGLLDDRDARLILEALARALDRVSPASS